MGEGDRALPVRGRRRRLRRFGGFLARATLGGLLAAGMTFAVLDACFPYPEASLSAAPPSPRVTSREGVPLLATVARDDQWRIPVSLAEIDPRVVAATIAVEDERFHHHLGVDPASIVRAMVQNVAAGEVVSGASTITMQLQRLLEPRPRTLRSKGIEAFRALQIERLLSRKHGGSKERILEEYLNRAPYGGNLVGVEAAARHYFGRSSSELTLAEAALLAGIPQGPSILRPDRYPERARIRRRTVLQRMHAEGMITTEERDAALATPIDVLGSGGAPHGLRAPETDLAPHAAWWALAREPAGLRTTIDLEAQRALTAIIDGVGGLPRGVEVAAVAIEIETGAVRALVGGRDFAGPDGGWVNAATAQRSPGSTLKPFIYALAFERDVLSPDSRVPDRPIERAGWRPRNFDDRWRGEVTVREALVDSLNVPAILVAEGVGVPAVTRTVERCGIALPRDPVRRAGLAVVVGALEVTLVDLVNGYATLGRGGRMLAPTLAEGEARRREREGEAGSRIGTQVLEERACAEVDAILGGDGIPGEPWWMAKTGTSARHRDAWAVGHDRRYAIGVWVGRPTGGGDPSLVGGRVALPILERIFLDPCFRSNEPPPRLEPRTPRRPMTFSLAGDPLRIEHPEDGGKWIALEERGVELTARASGGTPPYIWFLDGRAVGPVIGVAAATRAASTATRRIVCGPGSHELRLVDATGAVVLHRFSVRSAGSTAK